MSEACRTHKAHHQGLSAVVPSDNTPHLKEALEVEDLTQGHGHEQEGLKERPEHNARVGVH